MNSNLPKLPTYSKNNLDAWEESFTSRKEGFSFFLLQRALSPVLVPT
jgi:hypothetical protein